MKYDRLENNSIKNANSLQIEQMLSDGELILWKGKPKKKAFILESVFCSLLPFVLLWIAFDAFFLATFYSNTKELPRFVYFFVAIFFAFHLMPVWLWLSNVLTANKKYRAIEYCVTDKRIIIKSGLFSTNCVNILYKDIVSVDLHMGVFDKMCGTGDIVIRTSGTVRQSLSNSIIDIEKAEDILRLIQTASVDIQADMNYPNALRPNENPGYSTSYTRKF